MPYIGEVKNGKKLGYKNKKRYTWLGCIDCGEGRWVHVEINGNPRNLRCRDCSRKQFGITERGENHPCWKGGKVFTVDGYYAIQVPNDDFFYPMVGHRDKYGGYVLEHRLIMAKHLGRCLQSGEIIHHKNGIKTDNQLENLILQSRKTHPMGYGEAFQDGYAKGLIDGEKIQIEELKQEIRLLRLQISQIQGVEIS